MKKIFFFIFYMQIIFASIAHANNKYKILVGSPVHQKPNILKEFLESLKRLEKESFTLDYFFIEDNNCEESKQLLNNFKNEINSNCLIFSTNNNFKFYGDKHEHFWSEQLIWKVAAFKDQIIEKAINENYDYLFLIDSDLVLHPKTLEQLIKAKKDLISNIFWTAWFEKNNNLLPQVWVSDKYKLFHQEYEEKLTMQEINKRTNDFLSMLKIPGTYEVGGLGACTLISKTALNKGISFKKIDNLTMWGEDRHFCVRAAALGLSLFVDTHYPAFHIYRESDLNGIENFIKSCEIKKTRLTLSMIVKNEEKRYLKKVLEKAKEYITDAVIVDDGSCDDTLKTCIEVLKGIPLKIVTNNVSKFSNEIELRKQQWEETIKTNPDWVLMLDADEIFEDRFQDKVKDLITSNEFDAYYFSIYDFWDETHYRDDKYWQGSHYYYLKLARYNPDIQYHWQDKAHHCTRFPQTVKDFKRRCCSNLRVKHFGWAKYEDRIYKYDRYSKLDPDAKFGWKAQYNSILDIEPNLVLWKE